uniref:PDZ GRASP-type domain-containing protein n=1 Tax=Eutreptiella gymnastica TaxID=73025 RepID=A0A7S1JD48_9EUGL|mmetsp:Transcript_8632/g.15382  ORF Transcript_8632/g.15382 Transcript_8632/m.15382 type:complete len:345 (+) Transcript_8632:84-1118(+)
MGGEESKCGYQVSRVIENSPAYHAGLLPFFDFIVGVDGLAIEDDSPFFKDYLRTHNGQAISIIVYNSRIKLDRRVQIMPNDSWGGAGLLGCSIVWESIEKAYLYSWHILDIRPGSNAEKAQLQPHRDYIIGMQAVGTNEPYCVMFTEEQDFERRLIQFQNAAEDPQSGRYNKRSVLFLVFDTVDNSIREVMCDIPLGCEVGGGYMHTIPASKGDQRLPVVAKLYQSDPMRASQAPSMMPPMESPAAPVSFVTQLQPPPPSQSPQPPFPHPGAGLQGRISPSLLPRPVSPAPITHPAVPQSMPAPATATLPQPVPNPYTNPPQGGFAMPPPPQEGFAFPAVPTQH